MRRKNAKREIRWGHGVKKGREAEDRGGDKTKEKERSKRQ